MISTRRVGPTDWQRILHTVFIPFQLPYYIDGPVKITQSNAILKYIGEKHNLSKL